MVTGSGGPGRPPHQPWPALPSGRPPSGWEKLLRMLAVIRQRRLITGKRIGCAIVILVLLAIAALFAVSKIVNEISDVFTDDPDPVAGSPFDTVAPTAEQRSESRGINRADDRGYLVVALRQVDKLTDRTAPRTYDGFDIALVKLIAEKLAPEPLEIQYKEFSGGLPEGILERREADLVVGGFEITDERRATVGIIGPYLQTPIVLAVPGDSGASGVDDIGDGRVCVAENSVAESILAPRLGDRLETRESLKGCLNRLGAPAAAVAGEALQLQPFVDAKPDDRKIVGPPIGATGYGIGVSAADPTLARTVRDIVAAAEADGTWARIYQQYIGPPPPEGPPPLGP